MTAKGKSGDYFTIGDDTILAHCLCGVKPDMARTSSQPAVVDFFAFPLWLHSVCCGHVLWAYNLQHLQFIEDFVRAKLRERRVPSSEHGRYVNSILASRLPQWIKNGGNREDVLHTIESIRRQQADV
jgi:hypothetical protein